MALALTRIRRIDDLTMRLQLAALAAPLFGLVVAGFSGPTSASVPPAPYFWFVAGVLSYWLVTAYRQAPVEDTGAWAPAGSGSTPRKQAPIRERETVLCSSDARPR